MKFLKAILPNLCIALNLALITLVILDVFNPLAGLLKGRPFLILITLCCTSSIASAMVLYADWRSQK